MYKSFVRKIANKFLFQKKAEERQFPIELKEKDIQRQETNYIKIKASLKQSPNQEAIIDSAVERQIEEYLFFSKILMFEEIDEKRRKFDFEIFNSAVAEIFILSTTKDYEEKVETLFKLYTISARYIEKNNLYNPPHDAPIDSVGRSYAMRGIYNGFIMFIYSVEDIEL
ncbi:hypothetical protein [Lactococcus petauri]|uniref:hypothetical protein n=1 Tax=Lactococcus petauri TaxID=1940789 RepID=UPI003854F7EB